MLQSVGSQRAGHKAVTQQQCIHDESTQIRDEEAELGLFQGLLQVAQHKSKSWSQGYRSFISGPLHMNLSKS